MIATTVEQRAIIIISYRGNVLFYSLSISSKLVMKLTMGTSVIEGNLLRTKPDFIFVRLVSQNQTLVKN